MIFDKRSIRAKISFTIEMNHMGRVIGYPYLCLPGNFMRKLLEYLMIRERGHKNRGRSALRQQSLKFNFS